MHSPAWLCCRPSSSTGRASIQGTSSGAAPWPSLRGRLDVDLGGGLELLDRHLADRSVQKQHRSPFFGNVLAIGQHVLAGAVSRLFPGIGKRRAEENDDVARPDELSAPERSAWIGDQVLGRFGAHPLVELILAEQLAHLLQV